MRRTRWALLPVAALLVAACGQAVQGVPTPDQQVATQAGHVALDKGMAAIATYLKKPEFRSTAYRYTTLDGNLTGEEIDTSHRGRPDASQIARIRAAGHDGFDYDIFHPAKNTQDFVRLGTGYAKLAPTKWVSMPTFSASFTCAMPGSQTLCKLADTISATTKAAPPGLTMSASRLPDGGTDLTTAVTLKAFLDNAVIPVPTRIANRINPDSTGTLLPAHFVLNSDGTLRKVEFNGEVAVKAGTLRIQVGFEDKGAPSDEDIPLAPQPAEVTTLPDRTAANDFWTRFQQVSY